MQPQNAHLGEMDDVGGEGRPHIAMEGAGIMQEPGLQRYEACSAHRREAWQCAFTGEDCFPDGQLPWA